jgi:predicted ArsR family transcriptional regulator/anti-sigma regulatory factor (Ser/Thr protein kinase)
MDWYVEASDAASVHDLRREITAHLGRHADDGADVAGAEIAVSELLGNLVRHAAGPCWVTLNWTGPAVVLEATDLGPGFTLPLQDQVDPLAESGRGFLILNLLSEDVRARARGAGGSRVTVRIALPRRLETSHSPPMSSGQVLPDLTEARDEGGFGKESFLRALVVQLAQSVDRVSGPAQADRVVAQVGTDVGGQMEAEYRRSAALVDRMSPQQIADCLVRLKQAIDGGFQAEEVSGDRIVLVNTACPFGDAVRRAPALCRMTSSVFGGIAARNVDGGRAAVLLEERIAVGDARCRVTVYLGAPPAEVAPYAHHYDASGFGQRLAEGSPIA